MVYSWEKYDLAHQENKHAKLELSQTHTKNPQLMQTLPQPGWNILHDEDEGHMTTRESSIERSLFLFKYD